LIILTSITIGLTVGVTGSLIGTGSPNPALSKAIFTVSRNARIALLLLVPNEGLVGGGVSYTEPRTLDVGDVPETTRAGRASCSD